jgi:Adenylate kinase and related kinases
MNENPLILILLGKSGAGKGTQLNLLRERLGLEFIGTGNLLRERKKIKDFTGKKLLKLLTMGELLLLLFHLSYGWIHLKKLKIIKEILMVLL